MSGWENGWENIVRNNGVSIAISGISVVFVVLAVISGFITLLPRVLALVHQVTPEAEHHRMPLAGVGRTSSLANSPDESVAVAIGYAMHLKSGKSRSA